MKKISRWDWGLIGGVIFLIVAIIAIACAITFVPPKVPQPLLEITQASASARNLLITHHGGDDIWFANTKCLWTPDISAPDVTEDAGTLVLAIGETDPKTGKVWKFEPIEVAKLEKNINMTEGEVGDLVIINRITGQQIFEQTVKITA
jgi:hypothetical protein